MMTYETIAEQLKELYDRSWDSFGMLVLEFPAENIQAIASRLKEKMGFDMFLDLTAVDYPERDLRFEVVYHFYGSKHDLRLRLKTLVPESNPTVATLTGLYGSARFMEREAHEMYGIKFSGNDDLRPILLYEGFEGYPLRKDYPIDMEQPIVEYRK